MVPIVHHHAYSADLPSGHRFPMTKYRRLAQVLVDEGIVARDALIEPALASFEQIAAVHDPAYVRAVFSAQVPRAIERAIGLPITPSVALRARAATGGTLLAARLALQGGLALNTAGGSHHAGPMQGAGFCTFNDVAVAARVLLDEGAVGQILVIDLDVHQGDGTAAIFADEPRVFTFSMQGAKNYPAQRARSDFDIELADGTTDDPYLAQIVDVIPILLERVGPDLVFYNAGIDPHRNDTLGRLALSDQGLARRDRFVLQTCRAAGVPVAGVIGGGYDTDIDALARRHATLHREAIRLDRACSEISEGTGGAI